MDPRADWDDCHPDEWAELVDDPVRLDAVARNLREFPFLWAPTFRDCYTSEGAAEAAAERAAIVEHEAKVAQAAAEQVSTLARAYYTHIMGEGKRRGCCYPQALSFCPEGQRLREAYFAAASAKGRR